MKMGKMFGAPPVTSKDVAGGDDEDKEGSEGLSASKDLLEAIRDRDPKAVLAAFELLYGHCMDKHADDTDTEEGDEY